MGRDDDLVGPEEPERGLHRLERLGVSHLALGIDSGLTELGQARVQTLLCLHPGAVFVRGPVPKWGVERRADDEHLLVVALGPAPNLLTQRAAADRLVRDHQDAPLARA